LDAVDDEALDAGCSLFEFGVMIETFLSPAMTVRFDAKVLFDSMMVALISVSLIMRSMRFTCALRFE